MGHYLSVIIHVEIPIFYICFQNYGPSDTEDQWTLVFLTIKYFTTRIYLRYHSPSSAYCIPE
jgi:hypothetical protein